MTDRLDLANAFEAAGIERRAAERLADEVFAAIRENVATRYDLQVVGTDLRGDIQEVELRLRTEIAGLRSEIQAGDAALRTEIATLRGEVQAGDERLRGEIRDLHSRLVWWIIGTGAGAVVVIAGLLKLIH